jgi:hypothetical protein
MLQVRPETAPDRRIMVPDMRARREAGAVREDGAQMSDGNASP